jgi:uncharacterized membrane protein (UPF0127 family)
MKMKKRRIFLTMVLLITVWPTGLLSAELEDLTYYLPQPSELQGWRIEGVPQKAEGEGLFELIHGGAEVYLRAGFKRAIIATYRNRAGKSIHLKIFEMVSPESARSVYSQKTGERGEEVSLGNRAMLQSCDLNFWKANFQVTLTGCDSGEEIVEGLLTMAGLVEGKIGTWDYAVRIDGILDFLDSDNRVITSIAVEIADTPETHARGLMGRYLSDNNQGMLFVFAGAEPRSFWMRNTPTSLDVIFVGEDRRVINIAKETTPMSDKSYRSLGPARFVVEVKAGFADRYGIQKGTSIRWR